MTQSRSGQGDSSSDRGALRVSTAKSRGAAVIGLQGEFIGSEAAPFRRACNIMEQEGFRNWVVDLAEVEKLDGYGLASLVGLLSRVKRNGGRMVLCGINPDLRARFEATYCEEIFEIDFTVAKAVERLTKGADVI